MESSNQAAQAPEEKVSAESFKAVLFDQFAGHYQALSQCINRLPIRQDLKAIIVKEFDTGFLWTKEAFATMTFTPPQLKDVNDLKEIEPTDAV